MTGSSAALPPHPSRPAARPTTTLLAAILSATLASCVPASLAAADEEAPSVPKVDNVILVSIDSLRPDHLGTYGYEPPTSPVIDALAAKGLVFERAYSTTSWTLPSHMALLTGLFDIEHTVVTGSEALPPAVPTLAELASKSGVRTTGFFSGPYLAPDFGFDRGFDHYESCATYSTDSLREDMPPSIHLAAHADVTNPRLLAAVERWLKDGPPAQRNFLFLHMWDVHFDYLAPNRYLEMFDPDYEGTLTGIGVSGASGVKAEMDEKDHRHLRALYDAEIRYTDETLGRILDLLEKHGLMKNTALIVLADHGEEFFEHDFFGHRRTLYEEVVRIPLIVSLPGAGPAAGRSASVVSITDVFPAICELLDLECAGRKSSILQAWTGGSTSAPPTSARLELTSSRFPGSNQVGMVRGKHKVLSWTARNEAVLFDLTSDSGEPLEKIGPKSELPEHGKALLRELEEDVAASRTRAASRDAAASDSEGPANIRPEVLRQLRDLGYIE
jgi:arylsulfatase A-like enzyme